jgi:hypothetical protein
VSLACVLLELVDALLQRLDLALACQIASIHGHLCSRQTGEALAFLVFQLTHKVFKCLDSLNCIIGRILACEVARRNRSDINLFSASIKIDNAGLLQDLKYFDGDVQWLTDRHLSNRFARHITHHSE